MQQELETLAMMWLLLRKLFCSRKYSQLLQMVASRQSVQESVCRRERFKLMNTYMNSCQVDWRKLLLGKGSCPLAWLTMSRL